MRSSRGTFRPNCRARVSRLPRIVLVQEAFKDAPTRLFGNQFQSFEALKQLGADPNRKALCVCRHLIVSDTRRYAVISTVLWSSPHVLTMPGSKVTTDRKPVNLRLPTVLIVRIERLVESEGYANRQAFIEEAIREKIARYSRDFPGEPPSETAIKTFERRPR